MAPLWNVGAPSLPSAEAGRSPFFSVSSCLRVPFPYGSHSEGDGGLRASGVPRGPDGGECGGGGAGAAPPPRGPAWGCRGRAGPPAVPEWAAPLWLRRAQMPALFEAVIPHI